MTTNIHSVYKKLLERNKDVIVLGLAEGIVHWDMETKMPPGAVEQRSQQMALLSRLSHKMSTSPQIGKLLNSILTNPQYATLNEVEKRNVYLIKKNYDEQTKLPEKLVTEIAKQQTIAVNIWKKAKAQKNFNMFKPELEKLVDLNKQAAQILMQVKQTATPYDALVDIYEPKMTSQAITTIFNQLQKELTALLKKIQSVPNKPDTSILHRTVPVEAQSQIAKMLAETLSYDVSSPNARGRIDETEHPFTTGYYDDVRITTHYYPDNFASSIFSVLHETGHALYDQNVNQDWKYQPVGSFCSLGFHESQSRMYENIIGRSQEFWTHMLPKIKTVTTLLADVPLNAFVSAINEVKPSKIRIEADEVTYNLHIIIRFQIEKDLFEDKIKISELPCIWNQKYKDYLDITVENDSEGVMQDTHWASGLYGYFPTYALGNIYSGQIFAAIKKAIPNWRSQLEQGELTKINAWLKENILDRGNLYDPADLIRKVTGDSLDIRPYLQYLEKYKLLYNY